MNTTVTVGDLRAILAATLPAVSYDEIKPHMRGVLLSSAEGRILAVATNAERLHRAGAKAEGEGFAPRLLPTADAKRVLRSLPTGKRRADERVVIAATPEGLRIGDHAVATVGDGGFPRWEHLLPAVEVYGTGGAGVIGVNPVYFADACNAARAVLGPHVPDQYGILVRHADPRDAIRIDLGFARNRGLPHDRDFVAVIMPLMLENRR